MIDWSNRKRHTRYVRGLPRHEWRVLCICDFCGRKRYLKKADATQDDMCFYCSQKVKAPLGWRASQSTLRGRRHRTNGLADYRRAHPSDLERMVMLALSDLGVTTYRREMVIETTSGRFYIYDFCIAHRFFIEVDGDYWHNQESKKLMDRRKGVLLKRRKLPFLRLTESDIRSGAFKTKLREFLPQKEYA